MADAGAESSADTDSDDKTFMITYTIENFSGIEDEKVWSEPFEAEGRQWRVLCFPKGNERGHLSLFLECVQDDKVDPKWKANTHFRLQLVNQKDEDDSFFRSANHKFVANSTDWGFSKFMELKRVKSEEAGFLVDDKLIVNCTLEVLDQPFSDMAWWNYDSRKETGYVGILNQGATCYMNSLLQTLYHTNYFRKCVYQLPTESDEVGASIPLALQRLFYNLQFSDSAVSTKELTKSFGWSTMDAMYQHDVQELNRVLCDNLETKMKGTEVDGAIGKLFEGKLFNYIKCLNVDYSSTRTESFFDVSLDVKGNKNVYDAFEDYIAEDTLDGDNQYSTDDYGKQDAVKGMRFEVLPPILQLHLKRFQYDYQTGAFNKINDRFEFPLVLELDKYLSESADKSVPQVYDLFGVLIHSGGVQGGHYYAFIRPSEEPSWLRFDDDKVVKVKEKQAINENFGWTPTDGKDSFRGIRMARRYTNAYMLIYVRRADAHWVNESLLDDVIPEHLRERIERERAVQAEAEKARREAHLYLNIRIIRDSDLEGHRDVDLVNVTNVEPLRVKKDSTLEQLKATVEAEWGIPAASQRYWYWLNRKNKTSRPSRIVPEDMYGKRVTSLFKSLTKCKLFLEELPADGEFEEITATKANLFFKYYNPVANELTYVGRKVVEKSTAIADLVPEMAAMAGLEAGTELSVYEEIKTKPSILVDPVDLGQDLNDAELGNGDILAFQTVDVPDGVEHATVPEYFDYIVNRLFVKMIPLEPGTNRVLTTESGSAVTTTLDLTEETPYSEICAALARVTGDDPECIRLTGFNVYTKGPKRQAFRRTPTNGVEFSLYRMLYTHYKPLADTLYYEVLDMPVMEVETKRKLKLNLHNAKGSREKVVDLYVDRTATVGDALAQLSELIAAKAGEDAAAALPGYDGPLRMVEVSRMAKLVRVFDEADPVQLITSYAVVRVEPIPEEQLNVPEGSVMLLCNHYVKTSHHMFGDPFVAYAHPGETVAAFKERIKVRFEIGDEDFESWKFHHVSFSSPKVLADEEVLAVRKFYAADYIGIKHTNKSVADTRAPVVSRYSGGGKAIKIYN